MTKKILLSERIFLAGSSGMAGSAILRSLKRKEYGLKKVYVFTRYPMLGEKLREDGKYNTGMMVYAWYIFENHYSGDPIIDWIDNNGDVLNKKDKKT